MFNDLVKKYYGIVFFIVESVMIEQVFFQFVFLGGVNVFDVQGNIQIDMFEMLNVLVFYKELVKNMMSGLNDVMEIKDVFMNGFVLMVVYFIYILFVVFKEGDFVNLGFVVLMEKLFVVYGMVMFLMIMIGQIEEEIKVVEKFVIWMEQV